MGITAVEADPPVVPSRVRRRRWVIALVAALCVIGVAAWLLVQQVVTPLRAPLLTAAGLSVAQWSWSPSGPLTTIPQLPFDGERDELASPLDGAAKFPIVLGSETQGVVFIVHNVSSIPLRVMPSSNEWRAVAISTNNVVGGVPPSPGEVFRDSVTIPANEARYVRVLLTKRITCNHYEPGGGPFIDTVDVKVHAGWVTRSERVQLGRTVLYTGPADPAGVAACANVP